MGPNRTRRLMTDVPYKIPSWLGEKLDREMRLSY